MICKIRLLQEKLMYALKNWILSGLIKLSSYRKELILLKKILMNNSTWKLASFIVCNVKIDISELCGLLFFSQLLFSSPLLSLICVGTVKVVRTKNNRLG